MSRRLCLCDPRDGVVLQRSQLAGDNLCVEEVQMMHHAVRVLLNGVAKLAVNLQRDAELFAALAGDAFLRRFARLDLAAREFPEQTAVFVARALADQELVPLPDHRCRHFHHRLLRHIFTGGYTLPKFILS